MPAPEVRDVTSPEPIVRPNGKPYRPRTAPRVEEFYASDDEACLVVIGTHDLDVAAELARPSWESCYDGPLPDGVRAWWRLVPWSTGHGYDSSWIDDPVRGRPVVTYRPEGT